MASAAPLLCCSQGCHTAATWPGLGGSCCPCSRHRAALSGPHCPRSWHMGWPQRPPLSRAAFCSLLFSSGLGLLICKMRVCPEVLRGPNGLFYAWLLRNSIKRLYQPRLRGADRCSGKCWDLYQAQVMRADLPSHPHLWCCMWTVGVKTRSSTGWEAVTKLWLQTQAPRSLKASVVTSQCSLASPGAGFSGHNHVTDVRVSLLGILASDAQSHVSSVCRVL